MFLFTGNLLQISNIQHLTANLNHQTAIRRLTSHDFMTKGIKLYRWWKERQHIYWEGDDDDEAIKAGETEMTKEMGKWCKRKYNHRSQRKFQKMTMPYPTFGAFPSLSDVLTAKIAPLLYLPWADSCLIFPSARWILAQLLSISICAKVKSLQDLGLNMRCQATAPVDPLNPTRFEPTWTASCGDVSEGEAGGDGGRQVQPGQIVEPWFPAPSVIKSSPFCLTLWP